MLTVLGGLRLPARRVLAGLVGVLLLLACVACDGEADREPGGRDWPTGEPLDAAGIVWGKGHTIHFGDGTKIDTEDPYDEYAVAGDAVWFTKEKVGDEPSPDDGRLFRATRDGVEPTDSFAAQLKATDDGRYLVFLDHVNGPKDDTGTAAYLLVVIDTETGEETIRTTEGMDEAGPVGLSAAYGEGPPYLRALTDDTVYVSALGESHVFDLGTGDFEEVQSEEIPDRIADEDDPPLWNTAHTWKIAHSGVRTLLVGEDGAEVTPKSGTPRWYLRRWLDDDTVIGYAVTPGGRAGDESMTLMTCRVPSGECKHIPGATKDPLKDQPLLPERAMTWMDPS